MDQNERKQERIEHLRLTNGECGNVSDFSEGGMALFLNHHIAPEQTGRVQIAIEDLSLSTTITTAHCAPAGNLFRAGFKFKDLTEDSRGILREMAIRHSRGVPVKISFY